MAIPVYKCYRTVNCSGFPMGIEAVVTKQQFVTLFSY